MKKEDLKFITTSEFLTEFLKLTDWDGSRLVKVSNLMGYIPRAKELEEKLGISFGYIDPESGSGDVYFLFKDQYYILYCYKGRPQLYTPQTNSDSDEQEELVTFLNNL